MGASVFVAKRGGMIITCAATSGFMIEYDNRYLWMNLKTLKGCHFANYREAWEANRLVCEGRIHPTLSKVFPLDQTGDAAYAGAPQPARGQARRAVPRARRGPRRHRRGDARAAPRPDHPVPPVRGLRRDAMHAAPRSTTSPSRSTTSRPRSTTTATPSAARSSTARSSRRDGVEEALLKVADSYVQLLTPTRDDSPVAKYLENKGEGIHHVGYRVDDCAAALASVKAHGHRVIDEAPRPGQPGHDRRVRAPEDRVRHADRARPGIAGRPS